jgi:hypothetical protein
MSIIRQGGGRPDGGYRDLNGKALPGVTTILGRFKDSGGLIRWAYEQGKAAQRGEIRDLYDKRDQSADIGSVVHDLAESTVAGHHEYVQTLKDRNRARLGNEFVMVENGLRAFEEWFSGQRITIMETERAIVSERLGFGGTFDAIGKTYSGLLAMFDWKTSNAIYGEYIAQLGGYSILLKEEEGIVLEEAHLLRFSKEFGNFSQHQITRQMLDVGEQQFMLLLQAYKNDKILTRMAK